MGVDKDPTEAVPPAVYVKTLVVLVTVLVTVVVVDPSSSSASAVVELQKHLNVDFSPPAVRKSIIKCRSSPSSQPLLPESLQRLSESDDPESGEGSFSPMRLQMESHLLSGEAVPAEIVAEMVLVGADWGVAVVVVVVATVQRVRRVRSRWRLMLIVLGGGFGLVWFVSPVLNDGGRYLVSTD